MTAWLLLGLALLLITGNGVFVAAETALVTVDRHRVEEAARGGDARARRVAAALRRLSTELSGAQLGITVTSLAVGLLAEPSAARLLRGPLRALGTPDGAVEAVAVTLALLLASVVQMVFGELVPKNLALARPLRTAKAVITAQAGFSTLARPLIAVLNGTANRLLKMVGVEPTEELRSARSADELSLLVRHSADRGAMPTPTAQLLIRSLTFRDKLAADVMTPRVQVRFVDASATAADVITASRSTGHSRFPVVDGSPDEVEGLVHVKSAVAVPYDRRDTVAVREVMVPAAVAPSSLHLDPLLDLLRAHGLQMAVVVDEYGGTDGVVTFEDLVEELVGEVVDENDETPDGARRRRDGSWLLSGLLRPDEATAITGVRIPKGVTSATGARIPQGSYETLGGLVQASLGRVARVRDTVELAGAELRVQRMDGRRVDRIVLVPPPDRGATGGPR